MFRKTANEGPAYITVKNSASWVDTDLTALTGGGTPAFYGAGAAFYRTPNRQLRVYYVRRQLRHMHQLYYNNRNWSDADLTGFTAGPTASPLRNHRLREVFRKLNS